MLNNIAMTYTCLSKGGEMGNVIRRYDWSKTSLGSIDVWPAHLITTLNILLNTKFPMCLFWGEDLLFFYNDAFGVSLGVHATDSSALGISGKFAWAEMGADVQLLTDIILKGREATREEDKCLRIYRNGSFEDIYLTYSYSPVSDEKGRTDGVLVTCIETTQHVRLNRQLSLVKETARLAYWEVDLKDQLLYWSNELYSLFDIEFIQMEMPVDKFVMNLHPDDRSSFLESYRQTNVNGQSLSNEFRIIHKSGFVRNYYTKGKVITDQNGVAIRIEGSTQDITRHKQAEEELQHIFNYAPCTICVTDIKGCIKKISTTATELFEYNESELLNTNLKNYIQLTEKDKLNLTNTARDTAAAVDSEIHCITKSGIIKLVSWTVSSSPREELFYSVFKEIKERKELQTLLDKTNTMAGVGSYELDLTTGNLYWSDVTRAIIEVDNFCIPTVDSALSFYKEGYERDTVRRLIEDAIKYGKSWDAEHLIVTANNRERWVRTIGESAFVNGKCVRVYGALQDIDQRKKAELELKNNERKLETIYNSVSDVIFLISIEAGNHYKFVSVNTSFLKATGLREAQVVGQYVNDVVPSPSLEIILNNYNEAVATKQAVSWEEVTDYPSGTKTAYVTVSPILDNMGNCILLVGSAHDMTQQKKAEQIIIESEEKYRHLFEKSPMPMWIFDINTLLFLQVNAAAVEHYGYSREAFLTMSLKDIRPDEINRELFELSDLNFRKSYTSSSIHQKKNGDLIKVQVSVSAIVYEGKLARLALVLDRTEQEKIKDDLIATSQQLRELASHLQNIREEERTSIAREIHDELGQQLTGLKMDVSWLNSKLPDKDEIIAEKISEMHELLDATVNSVRRISTNLRPAILDDLGLIAALEWQSRETEKRSDIQVNFTSNVEEADFPLNITTGLFRICQEALTNAVKHSGASRIDVALRIIDNYITLEVADNGNGLEKAAGNKKSFGILGMRERTSLMNGTIDIKSTIGKGTVIFVSIPYDP